MMIGLPCARFSTKNGPACTNSAATLSICAALASSSSSAASLHQLSKIAVEHEAGHVGGDQRHLAGLHEQPAQLVARSAGSARGQSTTSTAGLRQAGAKKCVTVARSGCAISLKMRCAGSELVLEVIERVGVDRAPRPRRRCGA